MIKELSLSSDFSAWSWEQGNVNASDEQTKSSYDVLMNNGKCSNFSRYVWNDIIDMLSNALEGVGLEWDSTYCTADECKINESLGALMAYAWNSVAWNIKRLGFVAWEWSRSDGKPGHIGRDAVRGYSVYGDDSDNLFAWYVIELTKKLNRVIEVLKDEADFSNFEVAHQSSSVPVVTLAAPAITATTANNKSESIVVPKMGAIIVAPHETATAGYSFENSILRPTRPLYIPAAEKAKSKVLTDFKLLGTARMQTEAQAKTHVNTLLAITSGIKLIDVASYMLTQAYAQLFSATPFRIVANATASTTPYTVLVSDIPAILQSLHKSASESATTLVKGHSSPLPFVGKAYTEDQATAKACVASIADFVGHGNTKQESDVKAFGSAPMAKTLESETDCIATGTAGHSAPGESVQRSMTQYTEDVVAGHSAPGEHISESGAVYYAPGNAGHSAPVEKTLHSDTVTVPTARAVLPVYVSGIDYTKSFDKGEAIAGKAKWFDSLVYSESESDSSVARLESLPISARIMVCSEQIAGISKCEPCVAENITKAVSKTVASLSFYSADEREWIDPIFADGDLYIQQAWDVQKDENAVYIDS